MKVSIITVCRNCEDSIRQTIESVIGQNYKNIEYIVIDGASDDKTLSIINEFKSRIDILVSEKDNGIYDALNKGLRVATGDVLGFLHGDDEFASPTIISEIISYFTDESVSAVYGDLQYVSTKNPFNIVRHWRSRCFDKNLLRRGWMPPHPTLYVKKCWYRKFGEFDINFDISADYDSILRLFAYSSFNPVYLPKVIVKMKLGGKSNQSIAMVLRKVNEDFLILKKNGFSLINALFALLYKNISKLNQFVFKNSN